MKKAQETLTSPGTQVSFVSFLIFCFVFILLTNFFRYKFQLLTTTTMGWQATNENNRWNKGNNREGEGKRSQQPAPTITIVSPCSQGGLWMCSNKPTSTGGEDNNNNNNYGTMKAPTNADNRQSSMQG